MEYMSITQAAEKWGITPRRIQVLCKEERVPGASVSVMYGPFPQTPRSPRTQGCEAGSM